MSKCHCGTYRRAGHRWKVIERGKKVSTLKCMKCLKRFKSKGKYVSKLEDHKERSRKGMTDNLILGRILNGTLKVDPITSVVTSYTSMGVTELKQCEDQHESGYRFVRVCHEMKEKKIAVHRLQIMQHTKQLIPEGYDVHHKVSPPRPEIKDNALSNLELLPVSVNRSNKEPDF